MNIAVLTQPLHSNYGGILQAYALQFVLRKHGHNVIIINRCKGFPTFKEFIYRLGSFFKCVIRIYVLHDKNYVLCNPFVKGPYTVKRVPFYDNIKLRNFINTKINISKPIYSTVSLTRFVKKNRIDCIIVGSDQVWREDYSPCIKNYFLDFISPKNSFIKRISYAASFGVSHNPISPYHLNECINLLNKFDKISVREKTGEEYLAKVFHCNSKLVLDPTLLLDVSDYYKLINKADLTNSGLVSYILDENQEKQFIISDAVNRLNLVRTMLTIFPLDKSGNPTQLVSMSKWLAAFANSDFIVTDSFHGCVFSIIFRKNFIAIGNASRGIDRFYTLLGYFGLLDRLVLSKDEYVNRLALLYKPINYDEVSTILRQLKKQSLYFLLNI